jgi:hypothetical protein
VLDSLGEIFPNMNRYSKEPLDKLLDICIDNKITFIVIHHLNINKDDLRGSQEVKKQFDCIYYYYKHDSDSSKVDEVLLQIKVIKNKFESEDKSFYIKRKKESEFTASYEIINDEQAQGLLLPNEEELNVKEKILSYMRQSGKEEFTFNEIQLTLVDVKNKGSIKNSLKDLEDDKIIKKKDGKTWDIFCFLK